ncbi:MAG TPA: hypothetical protein VFX48_07520 [Saprospiraceae bacterium]|nr:hypothetical protein [Saprospiraceae bacterium]
MHFRSLLISLLAALSLSVAGQPGSSLFDSLYQSQEIDITLTYPFDSLYRSQREEIEARISIRTPSGYLLQDEPMTLNLRGKFRRMKCTMPPLLLNFKKGTLRKLDLSHQADEIKLVTHCMEGEEGQENLQEERLCYQLYEKLTPYAYRTIWVTVQYQDASGLKPSITSAGFLLEPDKDISSRFGLKEIKVFNVTEDSLHYESYANAVAFNFLIGNRDWSIVSSRNAKLFYDSLKHQYIVIPYDFDYANIVGATYRRENRPASMAHPFDRIYEGEYFSTRAGDILKQFMPSKEPILDVVETAVNPMDKTRRKKIKRYLEEWYYIISKAAASELGYGFVCPYSGGL